MNLTFFPCLIFWLIYLSKKNIHRWLLYIECLLLSNEWMSSWKSDCYLHFSFPVFGISFCIWLRCCHYCKLSPFFHFNMIFFTASQSDSPFKWINLKRNKQKILYCCMHLSYLFFFASLKTIESQISVHWMRIVTNITFVIILLCVLLLTTVYI